VPNDSSPRPATIAAPRIPVLGATEYGLIVTQAMLWGSTFFFIAIARTHVPPLTLSAARLIPAALLLGSVVLVMGLRLPATWPEWRHMLVFSTFNNALPFVLISLAQRETTGGIAAIFMAVTPLCGLLLAPWFIPEEKFTKRRLLGILVGIAGVGIITGASGATGTWSSQGMLVLAALCFGGSGIYARLHLSGYHPFAVASAQTIGALAVSLLPLLAIDQPWTLSNPGAEVWLSMLVMGIAGSGLSPLCHFTVLRRAGPVNAMLTSIVVPVTPIVLGVSFLGERLGVREMLGALIIALALVIIDGRVFQRIRRSWNGGSSGQ
jgi:drug/metabolite transporter (DMT)-like permease